MFKTVLFGFFFFALLTRINAIPVAISDQTDWDNYVATLSGNIIPAADIVTMTNAGNLDISVSIVNNGTLNIIMTSVEIKDNITFTNNGTLIVTNSTIELEENSTLINNGNITFDDCTFDLEYDSSVFTNNSNTTSINDLSATCWGTINNFGTLAMNHPNDDIDLETSSVFNNCGTIIGDPGAIIQIDGLFNTISLVTTITFTGGNPQTINSSICIPVVPTLSQWGLIILSLLVVIGGVLGLKHFDSIPDLPNSLI